MQNEYEAWEATGKGGEMSAGSQSHWGINGESRANRIDGEYINRKEMRSENANHWGSEGKGKDVGNRLVRKGNTWGIPEESRGNK